MPSKRKRTLAGFDDVADTTGAADQTSGSSDANVNNDTNNNVNVDANNDINNDDNTNVNNDDNVNVNNDTNVNNNDDVNKNVNVNEPEKDPTEQQPPNKRKPRSGSSGSRKPADKKTPADKPLEAPKIDEEDEESGSILDDLLGKSQRIEDTHVMRGIYIEKSLDKIIDRLAKKGGRGVKSKLVNEALKKLFKDKGLL